MKNLSRGLALGVVFRLLSAGWEAEKSSSADHLFTGGRRYPSGDTWIVGAVFACIPLCSSGKAAIRKVCPAPITASALPEQNAGGATPANRCPWVDN